MTGRVFQYHDLCWWGYALHNRIYGPGSAYKYADWMEPLVRLYASSIETLRDQEILQIYKETFETEDLERLDAWLGLRELKEDPA